MRAWRSGFPASSSRSFLQLHYRHQVNCKTEEGGHRLGRDAQFEHFNQQAMAFQAAGQPVIPADTKKKELIGGYKNAGSDYRPEACPDEVNVHDSIDKELGKAIPYGVYDIGANAAPGSSPGAASITTPRSSPSTAFIAGSR
jgi:Rhodopirellula transposase DDE domain